MTALGGQQGVPARGDRVIKRAKRSPLGMACLVAAMLGGAPAAVAATSSAAAWGQQLLLNYGVRFGDVPVQQPGTAYLYGLLLNRTHPDRSHLQRVDVQNGQTEVTSQVPLPAGSQVVPVGNRLGVITPSWSKKAGQILYDVRMVSSSGSLGRAVRLPMEASFSGSPSFASTDPAGRIWAALGKNVIAADPLTGKQVAESTALPAAVTSVAVPATGGAVYATYMAPSGHVLLPVVAEIDPKDGKVVARHTIRGIDEVVLYAATSSGVWAIGGSGHTLNQLLLSAGGLTPHSPAGTAGLRQLLAGAGVAVSLGPTTWLTSRDGLACTSGSSGQVAAWEWFPKSAKSERQSFSPVAFFHGSLYGIPTYGPAGSIATVRVPTACS